MKRSLLLGLTMTAVLFSCAQVQETEKSIEKKAAREVELSSKVEGDSTVHTTVQKFWIDNQVVATTTSNFKTANLKKTKDTVEQENGNTKVIEYDTKFPIFVTVK